MRIGQLIACLLAALLLTSSLLLAMAEEDPRMRNRATWDVQKVNRFIQAHQKAAMDTKGECDTDCVTFCRCVAEEMINRMPYAAYKQFFIETFHEQDLTPAEQKAYQHYNDEMAEVSSLCGEMIKAAKQKNTTLSGFEKLIRQLDNQDIVEGRNSSWQEIYRREDMILQADMSRVDIVQPNPSVLSDKHRKSQNMLTAGEVETLMAQRRPLRAQLPETAIRPGQGNTAPRQAAVSASTSKKKTTSEAPVVLPSKTVWLRSFSPTFEGNYVLTQTTLNCSEQSQVISHYSLMTPDGREVFGDHIPSPVIPLNLKDKSGEDPQIYKTFCRPES